MVVFIIGIFTTEILKYLPWIFARLKAVTRQEDLEAKLRVKAWSFFSWWKKLGVFLQQETLDIPKMLQVLYI